MKEEIRQYARSLGFGGTGFTGAGKLPSQYADKFSRWIEAGYNAEMGYLERNFDKRFCPEQLMESAKSCIVVAAAYGAGSGGSGELTISDYACCEDYHKRMKELMMRLGKFILERRPDARFKLCVDSVPLSERSLAVQAGLGFIGKSGMLIASGIGPRCFLGVMLTNIAFGPDLPFNGNLCGSCRRCIEACPTAALSLDKAIDCRRCISAQTIENKGAIPHDVLAKMTDELYGCDACVNACPLLKEENEIPFQPVLGKRLSKSELMEWSENEFAEISRRTVLARAGLSKLRDTAASLAGR
ncbi:MAG: tRNA epoxyqueuosine(34) reductase QueG [Phycisphaerae bacterium]